MDEDGVHDRVVVQDLFDVGELLLVEEDHELCEQLLELEVIEEVSLVLCLLREEDLELGMEDYSPEVQEHIPAHIILELYLVPQPQDLEVEYSDVALRVTGESLQYPVGTHQVLVEELRVGLCVGEEGFSRGFLKEFLQF